MTRANSNPFHYLKQLSKSKQCGFLSFSEQQIGGEGLRHGKSRTSLFALSRFGLYLLNNTLGAIVARQKNLVALIKGCIVTQYHTSHLKLSRHEHVAAKVTFSPSAVTYSFGFGTVHCMSLIDHLLHKKQD
jgi:hypothetical protein